MRKTIAIDIDGTLRNIEQQIETYLEIDYPERIDEFRKNKGKVYRTLETVFETKEELYKWMYEERVFEIFGLAKKVHPKVIDDLNIFSIAAKNAGLDIVIASVQRNPSVTATLHWLSKNGCKIQKYEFFNSMQEKIDRNFDFYVDDCPDVIKAVAGQTSVPMFCKNIGRGVPRGIKIPYEFTNDIEAPVLDTIGGKFDDLYEIFDIEKILKK